MSAAVLEFTTGRPASVVWPVVRGDLAQLPAQFARTGGVTVVDNGPLADPTITVTDPLPIGSYGYTLRVVDDLAPGADVIATGSVTVLNAATGEILLELPAAETVKLTGATYWWVLKETPGPTTLIIGPVDVQSGS